jgi:hypothetical protein
MIDRNPPRARIRGMSFYASSADYERRLSEDLGQAPEPDAADEVPVSDA